MASLFGSKAAYRATDTTIQPHRGAANIKDDLDERYRMAPGSPASMKARQRPAAHITRKTLR
jgi:hypothetical protein